MGNEKRRIEWFVDKRGRVLRVISISESSMLGGLAACRDNGPEEEGAVVFTAADVRVIIREADNIEEIKTAGAFYLKPYEHARDHRGIDIVSWRMLEGRRLTLADVYSRDADLLIFRVTDNGGTMTEARRAVLRRASIGARDVGYMFAGDSVLIETPHEGCAADAQGNVEKGINAAAAEFEARGSVDIAKELETAIDAIKRANVLLREMKNELCLICGLYANAHDGACDACRWRDIICAKQSK